MYYYNYYELLLVVDYLDETIMNIVLCFREYILVTNVLVYCSCLICDTFSCFTEIFTNGSSNLT